jgi:hypothetical protein
MRRVESYFLLSHGFPRVDDRLVIGGIIFGIRNDLAGVRQPRSMSAQDDLYRPGTLYWID